MDQTLANKPSRSRYKIQMILMKTRMRTKKLRCAVMRMKTRMHVHKSVTTRMLSYKAVMKAYQMLLLFTVEVANQVEHVVASRCVLDGYVHPGDALPIVLPLDVKRIAIAMRSSSVLGSRVRTPDLVRSVIAEDWIMIDKAKRTTFSRFHVAQNRASTKVGAD